MDISQISRDLVIHAKPLDTMPTPHDVRIGHVDRVENGYIRLNKDHSEDAQQHWIPLSWVERLDEGAVYLNKTVEEYLWGRLDSKPPLDGPAPH